MDVKTLCLGVLARGPCTGYSLRKAFEDGPFAHIQDAGYGSIYPALKRLLEEGAATCTEQEQDGRPDRKVYTITPKGRRALFDAVQAPPGPDKYRSDFMFVLLFADLLAPRDLDRRIEDRIQHHEDSLSRLNDMPEDGLSAGDLFILNYGRAMHAASIAFFESHRHELVGAVLQPQSAQ